jgi:hypothetical protein
MNKFLKIFLAFCIFFSVENLYPQVLKNNGVKISVKPNTKLVVNGNVLNQTGKILVETTGELRINGNFTVNSDTVHFYDNSLGLVTGNITIGAPGVIYRNPGYLTVFGAIFNSGFLLNSGGIIEIGPP